MKLVSVYLFYARIQGQQSFNSNHSFTSNWVSVRKPLEKIAALILELCLQRIDSKLYGSQMHIEP